MTAKPLGQGPRVPSEELARGARSSSGRSRSADAPHHRIVVVGGGLAGIAAALDCATAGADVTLLEVRPRLGGAAYSYERDGLRVDNGQHVFLRCCVAYRELLARLGVAGDVALQPRLDIPVLSPGRAPARLRRSAGLPAPLHLAASLARYPLLPAWERAAVARGMLALRRVDPDDPAAEQRSFGAWLAAHGQGAAAVEAIWRLIALPTLNLEPDDASLAQAAQVFQTGLLRDAAAGDVGWALVPLSDLHDGPARRALARAGVTVRLGWRAERVTGREGGGWAVEGAGGGVEASLAADAVIVAVPPERTAALLPPGALADPERLTRLGRSPIVNLQVHYGERVLGEPFAAGVGTPVQWVFDRTATAGVRDGQVVAVSLSAADAEAELDAEALRERYLPELARLLPRARGARVERFLVTREHAATFRAAPGARALRPPAATALPGLALAGAWTDTGWTATMEGAVRSGHSAAREALAGLRAGDGGAQAAGARIASAHADVGSAGDVPQGPAPQGAAPSSPQPQGAAPSSPQPQGAAPPQGTTPPRGTTPPQGSAPPSAPPPSPPRPQRAVAS